MASTSWSTDAGQRRGGDHWTGRQRASWHLPIAELDRTKARGVDSSRGVRTSLYLPGTSRAIRADRVVAK
jgi:hypothetical protein